MNYHYTLHPRTGKSPIELITGTTEGQDLISPAKGRVQNEEARQTLRKQWHDKKENATPTTITPGDKVLIKQQKAR